MAGDADDSLDERLPLGFSQRIADRKDFDGAIFLAGPPFVPRKRGIDGSAAVGNCADGIKEVGLVRLQLDEEVVAGVAGDFKSFFDSAWRPG